MISKLSFMALLVIVAFASSADAPKTIHMDVGEMTIVAPGPIERVAVGNSGLVSTSLIGNGQLLIFAEGAGLTTLHVWLTNGREAKWRIQVDEAAFASARMSDSLDAKLRDVRKLLGGIPGIRIRKVGSRIALSGVYSGKHQVVQRVKEAYPEILDLTLTGQFFEVKELVSDIGGIQVKVVGTRVVLAGEIDQAYDATIKTIQEAYPDVMDLTRKTESLEIEPQKMVLMNITISEFNTNFLETLGINWSTSINGPAGAFAVEAGVRERTAQGATILTNPSTPESFGATQAVNAAPLFGYFGIATEVVSRINLAVDTGNAVVLAEPRLVARSGGEANFLAGGEIPIRIATANTTDIEFKEFGILLEIQPVVDRNDNIQATVSTEISSVDQSTAVDGVPGFRTRRTQADVSLKPGDTLVLSGMVDRSASEQINKVAGLGDIPILGRLFRSKQFANDKTELVIFVTPYVYDAGSPSNIAALKRHREMLKEFSESLEHSKLKLID